MAKNLFTRELSESLNVEKFLLCRPRGGLNDTLCQIERCCRYSEKFDRILIIDTKESGLHGNFSEFFQPKNISHRFAFELRRQQLAMLNKLTCFPSEMRGNISNFGMKRWYRIRNAIARKTKVQRTFDFSKDYDEALLVHNQGGGGDLSFDLLPRLVISERIRPIILQRISHLNDDYFAVHVRNTDLKSSYKEFFQQISPEVNNKSLLICSDDAEVLSYARSYFNSSRILLSSNASHGQGKPLHKRRAFKSSRWHKERAIDSIIDLIALGQSTKLFVSNVAAGHISGFSRLAQHLFENKDLIGSLLKGASTD
jgi:hypothetical protein